MGCASVKSIVLASSPLIIHKGIGGCYLLLSDYFPSLRLLRHEMLIAQEILLNRYQVQCKILIPTNSTNAAAYTQSV